MKSCWALKVFLKYQRMNKKQHPIEYDIGRYNVAEINFHTTCNKESCVLNSLAMV